MARWLKLREEPGTAGRMAMAGACLALILLAWWAATRGEAEQRLISPGTLGSPSEVFGSFKSLWFERALSRNAMVSLWRVVQGFGLALLVGVPLGILAGCFPAFRAFLAPLTVFGRNVPVAAMIPLTIVWFGIDESQKVMFIFIACVAFVIFDAIESIFQVDQKYLDTAYTLGASRWQIIGKVLVPLALPSIFNSARLLFGLGFGYIILAEGINQDRGIGTLIFISQKRGLYEHVYLSLIALALLAYVIDRLLYGIGTLLFPYRYRK